MRLLTAICFGMVLAVMQAGGALAVDPDEILEDPKLEERARDISAGLRCLVCQNQSIDDSDAPLAKDLRVLVRERLVAGDTDGQIFDYVVGRYGEFVLLRPRIAPHTYALWLTPPVLLVLGIFLIWTLFRRRPSPRELQPVAKLSEGEEARLKALLKGDGDSSGAADRAS